MPIIAISSDNKAIPRWPHVRLDIPDEADPILSEYRRKCFC